MTSPFRTTMDGIVLGARPELAILGILWSLQSTHHGAAHTRSQVRVFAVGFLSTSPTRITEDINVRCPNREGVEAGHIAPLLLEFVPLGTHFIGCGIEYLEYQVVVEGSRHTDRFREDSHIAHVSHAMQCLAPPLEPLDAQARNGRGIIKHQGCLLLQGKTTTQIHRSLMSRESRILIRQLLCRNMADRQGSHQQRYYQILIVHILQVFIGFNYLITSTQMHKSEEPQQSIIVTIEITIFVNFMLGFPKFIHKLLALYMSTDQ